MLSRLNGETSLTYIAICLAVCGLGTGIFVTPNNSALMGSAPRTRQGIASGILATARNVGMVLGIGLSGAILTSFLAGGAANGLFQAVQVGFVVSAGVAIAAAAASAARGKG
jgi:MFS family permease